MSSYLWKRPSKTYYAAFFIFIFITLVSRQADAASTYIQNVAFSQDSQGDYISLDWKSIPTDSPSCIRYLVLVFFNRSNPNGTTVGDQYSESSYGDFTASGSGSYSGRGSYAFTSGLPNLSCAQNDSDLSTALPRTIKTYVNPGWEPKKLSFTSNDFITVQLIGYSLGSGYSQILENSTTQYYQPSENPLPIIPFKNVSFGYDKEGKLKLSFDWVGPSREISPLVGFNGKILYSHVAQFIPDATKDTSMSWESGANENTNNVNWLLKGVEMSAEKGKHYDLYVNELHRWTPTNSLTVCSWTFPCPISKSSIESVLTRKINSSDYITVAFTSNNYTLNDPNEYYYNPLEPVIFVPGILGTRLKRVIDDVEIWPHFLGLTKPGADLFLDELILNADGTEKSTSRMKADSILGLVGVTSVYKEIIDKLIDSGYAEQVLSTTTPYDWRIDIGKNTSLLKASTENAIRNSESGRINIIAHSMGGLLTKEYLRTIAASAVDKIIFLGTPHLGSPKAAKALIFGDNMGIEIGPIDILNPLRIQKISQNFPAVYQLLPSQKYFSTSGGYIVDARSTNPTLLSFASTTEFLRDFGGQNTALLKRADEFHEALDTHALPASTTVYSIVGCGNTKTIGKIVIFDHGKYNIFYTLGDKTVPIESAAAVAASRIYYTNATHSNLVKDAGVLDQIINILNDQPDVLGKGVANSPTSCAFDKKIEFATHSPVDLHVYDGQGRHLGPDANGDIEYGIPDSSYDTLGDNHFVIVPDSSTTTYRVVIDAYDTGSFDFDITKMNGTSTTEKISYLNQPLLSTSTIATLTYSSGATPTLAIDNEGNSSIDKNVTSTATVTGANTADITPPTIDVTSPDKLEYGRNEIITVSAVAADSESGLALFETKFDGFILKDSKIDLIELPLGTHTLNFLAFDKAGNPREITQEFTSYADATSTIAAINRAYNLRWIKNKDTRDDLISDIKEVMKLQKKIIKLEGKLPPAVAKKLTPEQKIRKEIQKLETKIDKKLGKELVKKIESKFKKDLLTIQAFVMLREDIEWMMQ